jgi:L-ascorbate metabolism protein UlaG (beta-lactamase superfamily)
VPIYRNLDGTTPDKGLVDLLKWQLESCITRRRPRAPFTAPHRPNDGTSLTSDAPHLTWIGHSTFVQRLGGKLIATDPIWSRRIHTIRRVSPPGVAFERCPALDIVTVSHAHYDHLDLPTLTRIGDDAVHVVPKDNADVLRAAGITRVVELGWWESHVVGDLRITLVPAQHWSMRAPWDKNRRLWGGFVFESPQLTTYHAGDTAFSADVFAAIAERFPRIDYAMLPIGAYDPPWFMSAQHMGPEEAGRAWEILQARTLVAMHWGTFALTDEPLGEPPERLRAWWAARGHDPERLWIVALGETRSLRR